MTKIFTLCVDFLYWLSDKLHLTYEQVNVLLFCILWPLFTLLSVSLNVYLLFFHS